MLLLVDYSLSWTMWWASRMVVRMVAPTLNFPFWTKVPDDSIRALRVSTSSPIYGKAKRKEKKTPHS